MKNTKRIAFEDALEDDDFGLIIGKDGSLKGMFVPQEFEDEDFINNHKLLNQFREHLNYGHKDVSGDVEVHSMDEYENVKWLKINNFVQKEFNEE